MVPHSGIGYPLKVEGKTCTHGCRQFSNADGKPSQKNKGSRKDENPSEVIFITINCFSFEGGRAKKIEAAKKMEIPRAMAIKEKAYVLKAVALHGGDSPNSGHYVGLSKFINSF